MGLAMRRLPEDPVFTTGEALVDLPRFTWKRGEEEGTFTVAEQTILWTLWKARGGAVGYDSMIAATSYLVSAFQMSSRDSVQMSVLRIRRKIGNDAVLTVHGFGYRLNLKVCKDADDLA